MVPIRDRTLENEWQNYVVGALVHGGAGRLKVFNPGSGEKIVEQAPAEVAVVDHAVLAELYQPAALATVNSFAIKRVKFWIHRNQDRILYSVLIAFGLAVAFNIYLVNRRPRRRRF